MKSSVSFKSRNHTFFPGALPRDAAKHEIVSRPTSTADPNSLFPARLARPLASLIILLAVAIPSLNSRDRNKEDYGFGFSVEVPSPESEVLEAVQEVVENGIIQGSKEYSKDQYIENAVSADSFPAFPKWSEPGKVFYKVRKQVLAPINFKASGDQGTLAVRYVVRGGAPDKTTLRIDAVFVDDFHHAAHPSNGIVESSEYKAIQDHIDAVELKKRQATDAEKQHQEDLARQVLTRSPNQEDDASRLLVAQNSSRTLEQHVQDLRHQVERAVKAPGAQLKTAPFRTASMVTTLAAGANVAILIVTPYWYGVESENGQHGWLRRDQLEALP
jgi:hypothetical protein